MKNKNIPDAIRFAPLHVAWMVDPQAGGSWCVMTRRDETPGSLNNFRVADCQHQADAVLFAAAPALLAALQTAFAVLEKSVHFQSDLPFWRKGGDGYHAMLEARAAIAQAEGEQ